MKQTTKVQKREDAPLLSWSFSNELMKASSSASSACSSSSAGTTLIALRCGAAAMHLHRSAGERETNHGTLAGITRLATPLSAKLSPVGCKCHHPLCPRLSLPGQQLKVACQGGARPGERLIRCRGFVVRRRGLGLLEPGFLLLALLVLVLLHGSIAAGAAGAHTIVVAVVAPQPER